MPIHLHRQTSLKATLQSNTTARPTMAPPPPAYTVLPHQAPAIHQHQHQHQHQLHQQQQPTPAISPLHLSSSMSEDGDAYAEDEAATSLSSCPFTIKISAPVTVSGSSNLLAFSPTHHATAIAHGLVAALKDVSMSKAGIPMIDEDGRPRPIELRVNAAVSVDGARNVLGERAVLGVVLATGKRQLSTVTADADDRQGEKRRAVSEPAEGGVGKKAKLS
ncbi:MAG: hypothetical protein M1818_005269 [Claussenomyces sp. TS43310]|nr:MAG: hypothetical protein M1818_005269 [Claussenomyces sp. TS43310]